MATEHLDPSIVEIERKVKEIVAFIRATGSVDDVPSDVDLFQFSADEAGESGVEATLGFDSLDGLELILGLQEEFDIDIPEELDMRMFRTVTLIAQGVSAIIANQASDPVHS